MHSPDLTQGNIARIQELFPGCVAEARAEDGTAKLAVDFDQLRQELASTIVQGPHERYQLNWPGKREALLTANAPIAKTLRPCRNESVDFEATRNLFIEGDNLDALKLLQQTYLNKIKMIYIDPPYNTGGDFIYKDNFALSTKEYLRRSNQRGDDANRSAANVDTRGRFHSDWLSMIYARLKLARNILRDDGVIFISIGDDELPNLIKVCDEVFGSSNAAGIFVWEKKKKPSFLRKTMGSVTEYIVSYAKSYERIGPFVAGVGEEGKKYPFNNAGNAYSTLIFPPRSVRFSCADQTVRAQDMSEGNIRTRLVEDVEIESGTNKNRLVLEGEWRYSQESLDKFIQDGEEIRISRVPFRPNYINRSDRIKKAASLLSHRVNGMPTNEDATDEIRSLFGADVMDYPKPTGLLSFLIKATTSQNDLVMDFFAGSASTAAAVLRANLDDHAKRRFIMVQVPEKCAYASDAAKLGFHTIAEVAKERIRRSGKKLRVQALELDTGFRVLKVDSSNLADVYYASDERVGDNLDPQVDHVKSDRSAEDLLFQVMLDWGLDLALPIDTQTIQDKPVFLVGGNALAACFDAAGGIDQAFVRELAKQLPLRVMFRDNGFKDSATKIEVAQMLKLLLPATEVKCL